MLQLSKEQLISLLKQGKLQFLGSGFIPPTTRKSCNEYVEGNPLNPVENSSIEMPAYLCTNPKSLFIFLALFGLMLIVHITIMVKLKKEENKYKEIRKYKEEKQNKKKIEQEEQEEIEHKWRWFKISLFFFIALTFFYILILLTFKCPNLAFIDLLVTLLYVIITALSYLKYRNYADAMKLIA